MTTVRYLLAAAVCAAACLPMSFGQSAATFTTRTHPAASMDGASAIAGNAIDVNNDGIPDILQSAIGSPSGSAFAVNIANGDGTFKAPVTYPISSNYNPSQLASGDFNGDGIVDLAFALQATNQIAIFFGKGDGAFGTPKMLTVALPSSSYFWDGSLLAADLNGDGHLDLIAPTAGSPSSAIYALAGDGTGNFAAPRSIYGSGNISQLVAGDFDGDAIADLAFLAPTSATNCDPQSCPQTVHVLFGDGNFGFQDTTQYDSPDVVTFSAGDVNSDGITDLFGFDHGRQDDLVVLYGRASGVLSSFTMPTTGPAGTPLALADFNGDGRMDLVTLGNSGNTRVEPYNELVFYLGNASGGFTPQTYSIPGLGVMTPPIPGTYNGGLKPDIAIVAKNPDGTSPTFLTILNTTSNAFWGACPYPKMGEGIAVCSPLSGSSASPIRFAAMANSYGSLRKIELWVDGKKLGEEYHAWENRAWFQKSLSLPSGTHHGTFIRNDIDNTLQKFNFTFTVK